MSDNSSPTLQLQGDNSKRNNKQVDIESGLRLKEGFTPINIAQQPSGIDPEEQQAQDKTVPHSPSNENGKVSAIAGETEKSSEATKQTIPKKHRKPRNAARPIPTSIEEASPEDLMVIDMKGEGKTWAEIGQKWAEKTGEKAGASTLSNRYGRLMAGLHKVKPEDRIILKRIKKQVEAKLEGQKWACIAAEMVKDGAGSYSAKVLEKTWKDSVKSGDAGAEDE
ncbi:MAG: hypothetical protein M1819_007465 [Sarea resinae]|nr:MAG: hypothetical protein M1819_007465 [Sarea resinae]